MSDLFKYYLTDKDGKSFFVQDGVVQTQGQPRPLENTPDGWQDIAIEYERNEKYFGLFRNFSLPLGFVKDGAQILKHVFHKFGFEYKLYLIILKRELAFNDDEYGLYHKSYYKGEIDLSTFVQEEFKVTVNVLDNGLEALIKANENTEYEIELFDNGGVAVRHDGMTLVNTVEYVITDGFSEEDLPYAKNHTMDLQEVRREVTEIIGVKDTQRVKVKNNNQLIKNTGQWFLRATVPGIVTIEYDYQFIRNVINVGAPFTPGLRVATGVRKVSSSGVGTGYIFFQNTADWNIIGSDHVVGTIDIPVEKGDELFPYSWGNVEGATGDELINFFYSGAGLFRAKYYYRGDVTTFLGFTPDVLLSKLVDKITEGKYGVDTTFLKKKNEYFITSGEAIRGIDRPKIKTNLADFWQWLWSNEDVYLSVKDNKVVIGELKELYRLPPTSPINGQPIPQDTPVGQSLNKSIDIGEIRNLKISLAKELIFNRIKVGCPNQNYEDVNGRSEFNSTQQWTVNVTRDSKELDLVSPYREDGTGIEYTRINFGGKETTDAASDNEVFVMYVDKKPINDIFGVKLYKLDRTANPYVTGVIDPSSVYNVKLSPKHKLLRKGRCLRSCLELDSEYLKFQTGEKNTDLIVNYPTGIQAEKDNLQIGSIGERYFLPKICEIETFRPLNLVEIMNAGEYRNHCFKFMWSNLPYYGFVQKVGIQPADHEVQTYQLLSSPKNDLSTT